MGTSNDSGAEIRAPLGRVRSRRSAGTGANGNLRKGIAAGGAAGWAKNRFRQLKNVFWDIWCCRQYAAMVRPLAD